MSAADAPKRFNKIKNDIPTDHLFKIRKGSISVKMWDEWQQGDHGGWWRLIACDWLKHGAIKEVWRCETPPPDKQKKKTAMKAMRATSAMKAMKATTAMKAMKATTVMKAMQTKKTAMKAMKVAMKTAKQ